MNKKIYILLLLIFDFVSFPIFSQSGSIYNSPALCNTTNKAFKGGEKIKYKIYYNWGLLWVPAGYVEFEVNEKKDQYYLKAKGKTYPSYSWLFSVDDYFYSYVDKQTIKPKYAKRDIEEGDYKIFNEINFNQTAGTATSYVKENDDAPKNLSFTYDNCMFDLLSLIYKLRNIEIDKMKVGEEINFQILLDSEVYDLNLEYLGKNPSVQVNGMGKFKAFKISPTVIKGRVFDQNERMNVWISDDKAKLPLIIESPLAVGKIKVILQEYENIIGNLAKVE